MIQTQVYIGICTSSTSHIIGDYLIQQRHSKGHQDIVCALWPFSIISQQPQHTYVYAAERRKWRAPFSRPDRPEVRVRNYRTAIIVKCRAFAVLAVAAVVRQVVRMVLAIRTARTEGM